jgi:hypothetical protein
MDAPYVAIRWPESIQTFTPWVILQISEVGIHSTIGTTVILRNYNVMSPCAAVTNLRPVTSHLPSVSTIR